jgi:imidazolonepropionase-like amidohydrolase
MTDRTILTDLKLWNGHGPDAADTLVFEQGRIASVCSRDELTPSDRTAAVSLAGASALPGLIDAHVHMVLDPEKKAPPGPDEAPDPAAMRTRARAMVEAGITAARDLGGGAWAELELRDAIARGETPGPRLVCSGQPITSTGGHCHFWGGEAADAEAARTVIQRQVEKGVDLIKVMATGGRFTRGSAPLAPQFDLATLTTIVASAAEAGLRVAAHCHGTPGIEFAARAGVHSIEHCSWVGPDGWASDYRPEVTEVMAARGVWVSPTVNAGWQRFIDGQGKTLTRVRSAYQQMLEAGIPFMASTDAGIPGVFHQQLARALAVFAAIGELGNEEALRTATSEAARGIGLGTVTGRLVRGYDADVLVVDGDPAEDLGALTRPVAVWARGRCVRQP